MSLETLNSKCSIKDNSASYFKSANLSQPHQSLTRFKQASAGNLLFTDINILIDVQATSYFRIFASTN
jgi:hypothetical protein